MHFPYDITFYVTGKIDVPVVGVTNYTSNLIVTSHRRGRSPRCDNIAIHLSKSEKVSLFSIIIPTCAGKICPMRWGQRFREKPHYDASRARFTQSTSEKSSILFKTRIFYSNFKTRSKFTCTHTHLSRGSSCLLFAIFAEIHIKIDVQMIVVQE